MSEVVYTYLDTFTEAEAYRIPVSSNNKGPYPHRRQPYYPGVFRACREPIESCSAMLRDELHAGQSLVGLG